MAIIKAPISASMLTLGAIEAIYDFITYSSMKKGQFCIQLGQIMSLTGAENEFVVPEMWATICDIFLEVLRSRRI